MFESLHPRPSLRILLAAALSPFAAQAQPVCEAVSPSKCLYVHPTEGQDGNPGTFAAPLRVPQRAVVKAGPGDVVYLRGGTYTTDHSVLVSGNGYGRRFIHLGDARYNNENWSTANGTADRPITVKAYPGEKPYAKDAGQIAIGSLRNETAHWIIEGLTIDGNNVNIWGGSQNASGAVVAQTHHITIRGNDIFNYREEDRFNAGLIKIDRGDWGGPSEIVIEDNILHDLYATGCQGCSEPPGLYDWQTTTDFQHFGAITSLSCESYVDVDCGGNGALTIRRNVMYNVPMVFFFKNPARGPVVIEDNVMFNAQTMGRFAPSNVRFERNLVHEIPEGLLVGGFGGRSSQEIYEISGRNLTMRYNTFIGVNGIVKFTEYGSHHDVQRNVVFGLTQRVSRASFDTPGFISRYLSDAAYPDPGPDLEASELNTGNRFDENCFVTPHEDFIAVSRYLPGRTAGSLTHLPLSQARNLFGFEADSRVLIQPNDSEGLASVFADPGDLDFRLRSGLACADMGINATNLPVVRTGDASRRFAANARRQGKLVTFASPRGTGSAATLEIFDVRGGRVMQPAGATEKGLVWDASRRASGAYLYRMREGCAEQAGRVLLGP